ncbi:OsmC family protein [Stappia sp. ES.058]|uniref:OsmC family protein n=1 Tax=Stappia sp. ES.058 TaxID=1881061 RepID=UPI00087BB992|nr:OsmC family protein [Stappia sp. ES.058]SDT92135.1 Organic hydroperoxide reductase OsmC/OhrA [Stappia sp. ES.058]
MAKHLYRADVSWRCSGDFAANTYSRGHDWSFDGGITVPASASPSVVPLPHSVEAAVDPEEAFVAAISSCHMLWFLDLARRDGLEVESYTDRADGTMDRIAPGKMAVTHVALRPEVVFSGDVLPDADRLDALHHKAHEACFIANSVTSEIVIEARPARLAQVAQDDRQGA